MDPFAEVPNRSPMEQMASDVAAIKRLVGLVAFLLALGLVGAVVAAAA